MISECRRHGSYRELANSLFIINMPSTVIAEMNYNAEKQILRIRFVSGLIYEYLSVPEEIFAEMKKSGSKGNFLNTRIKGNYRYKKVNNGQTGTAPTKEGVAP